jgi:hypothetical protein
MRGGIQPLYSTDFSLSLLVPPADPALDPLASAPVAVLIHQKCW